MLAPAKAVGFQRLDLRDDDAHARPASVHSLIGRRRKSQDACGGQASRDGQAICLCALAALAAGALLATMIALETVFYLRALIN
jgi:hypothetical protein